MKFFIEVGEYVLHNREKSDDNVTNYDDFSSCLELKEPTKLVFS